MPRIFLSPSTQEWNVYQSGASNEELCMNRLADEMEPYLRASGIAFVRNDPARNAAGAIQDSNMGYFDVHLALHTNASPEQFAGKLRGIDIYYSPLSYSSQMLANMIANNLQTIYPLPGKSRALPTTTLGEVTQTRAVAVLCELGYHDNPEDEAWICENLRSVAANLTASLCDYFGIPFLEPSPIRVGIVTTDGSGLNLRGYPSMEGRIIGSIPDGTTLNLYGQSGNWYVVTYGGQSGYVNADYIQIMY